MLDFKLKRLPGGCEGASCEWRWCGGDSRVCRCAPAPPSRRTSARRGFEQGDPFLRRGKRSCDVSSCERNDRSLIIFPYIYIYIDLCTLPTLSKRRRLAILERGRWSILGISIDRRGFLSCLIIREKEMVDDQVGGIATWTGVDR